MLRNARMEDVPQMVQLVNSYAQKDIMLGISTVQTCSKIREFTVAEENEEIIGCGALYIYMKELAEIRSLAVKEKYLGNGVGKKIVEHLCHEAKNLGINEIFTLTLKPEFFEKIGFSKVEMKKLPQKIWKDCVNCTKFPKCDEVALKISLN
jgi:amino-acid N-acetyltransferase